MAVNERGARRVALVGAGYIADFHAEALRRTPGVTLAAVCDLSRGRAERVAERFGIEGVFAELPRMLAEARIDAAHVLTPPQAHASPTRTLLEAGVDVLVEKPLTPRTDECRALAALADERKLRLGVGHNFLFAAPYERLHADVAGGRLGRLDQVDIIWNKPLPQINGGPFGSWLFEDPRNILFEVAPHSFAHAVHLLGADAAAFDRLVAHALDPVALPGGRTFYRQWEIQAWRGTTSVRLRFAFGDGYPEHRVHVRGTAGSGTADLELDTYVRRAHSNDLLDLDRFSAAATGAGQSLAQAGATLGRFLGAKLGLPWEAGPYATSIARAVRAFHATEGSLDERLSPALAAEAVAFAERVGAAVVLAGKPSPGPWKLPPPVRVSAKPDRTPSLVLGGTGFIGRALVRRLRTDGHPVRVLTRDPGGHAELFKALGVEVVRGDTNSPATVDAAMAGVQHVFHLARGHGRTWADYQALDIEPTRRLAERCAAQGAQLLYTSSIAIYNGGRADDVITEATPPDEDTMRVNLYARAKVEIERMLLALHRDKGLRVVLFRPGIVIGSGGSPFHWGVGMWPYTSLCRLWGDGTNDLPIVLVDDCADALVRALGRDDLSGDSFNLVGEPCLSANAYLDELERSSGLTIRRIPTAPWRYYGEDLVKWAIKTATRTPERRQPSYRDYVGRAARARFSGQHAIERLGWAPTRDRDQIVEKGIRIPVDEFLR